MYLKKSTPETLRKPEKTKKAKTNQTKEKMLDQNIKRALLKSSALKNENKSFPCKIHFVHLLPSLGKIFHNKNLQLKI